MFVAGAGLFAGAFFATASLAGVAFGRAVFFSTLSLAGAPFVALALLVGYGGLLRRGRLRSSGGLQRSRLTGARLLRGRGRGLCGRSLAGRRGLAGRRSPLGRRGLLGRSRLGTGHSFRRRR